MTKKELRKEVMRVIYKRKMKRVARTIYKMVFLQQVYKYETFRVYRRFRHIRLTLLVNYMNQYHFFESYVRKGFRAKDYKETTNRGFKDEKNYLCDNSTIGRGGFISMRDKNN